MKCMSKSNFLKFLFGIFLIVGVIPIEAHLVETIDVHYTKEQINRTVFEYRQDIVNGTSKESWLINTKKVDPDIYEEAILDAEKEMRRQERRVRLEQRLKEQKLKAHSQFALNKKILQEQIQAVEHTLALVQEYDLQQFLIFNDAFSRDDFDALSEQTLPEAKRLLATDTKDIELIHITDACEKLDSVPHQLHVLFHTAIDHATKVCSDTKKLKRLLELTAQA